MWVQFLKTYSGPLGLFVMGEKKDLPKDIVDKFPKGTCNPVPAPWDEHIDHKAIAAAEKKNIAILATAMQKKVNELESKMIDLSLAFETAQKVADKALKLMKQAQKNMGTEKGLKHFNGLKRELQFADARLQIANSRLAEAQAERNIAEMETENAEREAAKLAEEAGIKFEPAKRVPDAGG